MPTPTTTTHKASSSSADKQKHQVKQPPRTPQEFQFAHRTLRKLVQDSTFFPDAAQRDDWFRPRRIGGPKKHRGSGSSSSSNNYNVSATTRLCCQHDDDDDDDELSSCGHDNQHQQQQRQRRIRDRKTPLFIDYCRRKSLEDQFNSSQLTTGSCSSNSLTYYNHHHHHRGSSGGAGGGGGGGGSSSIISCSASHSSKSYCSTSVVAEVITTTANSTITAAATTTTAALSELDKSCASSPISVCSVGATAATAAELPFRRSNHSSNHSSSSSVGSRQQQQERITTLSRRPSFHGGVSVSPHHQLVVVEQQQTCCNDAAAQSTITTITTTTTTAAAKRIKKHSVHSIHERELEFGKILGSGGFGQVRLARIRNCMTTSSSSSTATESSNPKEEAATSNNSSSNKSNQYYAMKYLSPHKTSPPPTNNTEEKQSTTTTTTKPTISKFERGIADLAMEARFLSLLSHENIVTLWFVSEGSLEEVFNCGTSGNGGGNGSSSSVGSVEGRRGSGGSGRSGTTTRRRRSLKHNNNSNSNGRGGGYHHYRQHGYFLLLDALHETLHQRIQNLYIPEVIDTPLRIYYETEANNKKYRSNERVAKIQLARRLESLKSIASALQYLHEDCNLIYRDIKPGNIGFYRRYNNDGSSCVCGHNAESNDGSCTCNYTDIPKLFDFGLAKELKSKYRKAHPAHSHDDPPTFKLTSATGSRRYMSPEVALREPYNHKADVYSFGMVLYQISALVVPFDGLEVKSHEREVMREGVRPDVTIPSKNSSVRRTRDLRRHYMKETDRAKKNMMLSKRARCVWPEGLNALISECWDGDMRKRPEMREVVERLDACIEELNQRSTSS